MAIADQITGVESGGDPTATNPNSSATGAGQFIASTWLDTLAKHRPDIQGTPDELLALRNDPTLSKEMTAAYAGDNQAILSKAGLPVTPGTTYLAHFSGPQGAVKILQADPNAPVSDILGAAAVKANPFLQGMTAQGLQAWAAKKMGTPAPQSGSQPSPQTAPPTAPAAPQPPLQAPPQTGAPIFAAQPQAAPEQPAQGMAMPQPQTPAIFVPPRKPIDLSGLRAALANRAPIFSGQG